jgi:hypothetical protein
VRDGKIVVNRWRKLVKNEKEGTMEGRRKKDKPIWKRKRKGKTQSTLNLEVASFC